MRRRTLLWTLALLACSALILIWALQWRSDALRGRIARGLGSRFNADVTIDRLAISVLPRLRLSGSGLTLRVRGRADLPPFISIQEFWMDMQPLSIMRRHVDTVHFDGLRIQVPPKDARRTLRSLDDIDADDSGPNPSHVMIEHLVSHDAELSFVPDKPGHRPLVFPIKNLELEQLAFDRPLLFKAELINPVPVGLINATGTFGPWVKDSPADSPVAGRYVFSDADLSTIDGISGMLSSVGSFDGRIGSIDVRGTTKTPDFNLRLGGRPLPLETTFSANVDGTNGTTILRAIDAQLRRSSIKASGAVVNLPGPGRHDIKLSVAVPKGRIEDMLAFVTQSKSVATGDVKLRANVNLPPGHSSTLSRLGVAGEFGLAGATFKSNVQERVRELSRRSQGKGRTEMDESVASDVAGTFALDKGVLRLRDVSFDVPGAEVRLSGTCDLRSRALDLHGTLRMQASVSQAVGGVTSIFLKVVDPFFHKHGEGTVLKIGIVGTIDAPEPKLELRRK